MDHESHDALDHLDCHLVRGGLLRSLRYRRRTRWKHVAQGPDGQVWFGEYNGAKIAEIDPATDVITEYPLPSSSQPEGITSGPDGNLYFGNNATTALGAAYFDKLIVTQQPPSRVTAGVAFGFAVEAVDASGNLVPSFNGTVTVSPAPGRPSLGLGGTLSVTATNGVASFSGLTLTKTGNSLLQAAGDLGPATTSSVTVTPAAATQLVISNQPPATVKVNTAFGFHVAIQDQYGNVVTTANNTVGVAFANNPTGATLGGMLSIAARGGVATFSNLTINKTGSGYTLKVSSSGLTGATSTAINVTKSGRTPSLETGPGGAGTSATLLPLLIDIPDLWEGLPQSKRLRPFS